MSKKYRSRDYHGYWETIKSLPTLQAKWDYTWDNWKLLIIAILFGFFFIITMAVSIYRNSAPIYLSGEYINIVSYDDMPEYEEDYLEQAFLREYLQIPETDRTRIFHADGLILDLSSDEAIETTYNNLNTLDAHMAAHEIDYMLMPESLVDFFEERYDAYIDLRDLLTEEEMELYADRLYYTKSGIPAGIDITGSELIAKMGLVCSEPIHLVWYAYINDPAHMRPFFDFVMGSIS